VVKNPGQLTGDFMDWDAMGDLQRSVKERRRGLVTQCGAVVGTRQQLAVADEPR
jgi:hypothetical protein